MKTGDTVFVTTYALTKGVLEGIAARLTQSGCASVSFKGVRFEFFGRIGREVFATEAEAIADAEKRRQKAIESAKKRIRKLEAMTFKAKGGER